MATNGNSKHADGLRGYRFGVFELDLSRAELRKCDLRLRLPYKSFLVLAALLDARGEVVSRRELRERLWPEGIHVDFELSLNTTVRRLREVLGDSAETPVFVETLPRVGYRWLGSVEALWANGNGGSDGHGTDPIKLSQPEPLPAATAPALPRRLWTGSATVMAVLAVALVLWWSWPRANVLDFHERDWVLIAAFENRTGETIFDGSLEAALERELSNSRFVNVVPFPRVQDSLYLMRQPLDARLTPELAREVAVRDGGVRVVISGRIEKMGDRYLLSATLLNPAQGTTLAAQEQEAADPARILAAVQALAHGVRRKLGEVLPAAPSPGQELQRAMTVSLDALQLYSRGMQLVDRRDFQPAAELFRQALDKDPNFASAHIYLAHCLTNVAAAEHFERAYALAPSTTDVEKYFILGSYYSRFRNDNKKAVEIYRTLLGLYPDHYWANNNVATLLQRMDRWDEALPYVIRRAQLRPNWVSDVVSAGQALEHAGRDEDADPWFERSFALCDAAVDEGPSQWFCSSAAARMMLRPLQQGRLEDAVAAIRRAEKWSRVMSGHRRDAVLTGISSAYRAMGQLRAAEEMAKQVRREEWRGEMLARAAEARGDDEAARFHLAQTMGAEWPPHPFLFFRHRLMGEGKEAFRRHNAAIQQPERAFDLVMGDVARIEGRWDEAIQRLGSAAESARRGQQYLTRRLASRSLALALAAKGKRAEAIAVLERELGEPATTRELATADELWLRFDLLQLYEREGRTVQAVELAGQLRAHLVHADDDHVIAKYLR